MPTEVLKLGYDAAIAGLARQDSHLSNLRNRAVTLLSAATITTTVASGLGLLGSTSVGGPAVPRWIAISVLLTTTVIGGLTLGVLWPIRRWHHVINPAVFLHHRDSSEDSFREAAIAHLDAAYDENQSLLDRRTSLVQLSVVLLIAALVVIAVSVLASGS